MPLSVTLLLVRSPAMFETITKALTSLVDFSEEELFFFMKHLKPQKLKKNEQLLMAGEVCRAMALIETGALRYYSATDKGEQNYWFAFEGQWLGDYGSFLSGKPSLHYIQALEDTVIFTLNYSNMQELYQKGRNFEKFGRLIAEQLFLSVSASWADLSSLSAESRYLKLLQQHPDVIKRVSQQHIATYLGIQPQSLSRIRSRLGKSKS